MMNTNYFKSLTAYIYVYIHIYIYGLYTIRHGLNIASYIYLETVLVRLHHENPDVHHITFFYQICSYLRTHASFWSYQLKSKHMHASTTITLPSSSSVLVSRSLVIAPVLSVCACMVLLGVCGQKRGLEKFAKHSVGIGLEKIRNESLFPNLTGDIFFVHIRYVFVKL